MICRSTLQAETDALTSGVEESTRTRAAMAGGTWLFCAHSLGTERCEIHAYTFTKCSDKRLSIGLAALRQVLWLTPESELRDEIGPSQPEMVMWICTTCTMVDCLTKRMNNYSLDECLRSGVLDLKPTDQIVCEIQKHIGRARGASDDGDLKFAPLESTAVMWWTTLGERIRLLLMLCWVQGQQHFDLHVAVFFIEIHLWWAQTQQQFCLSCVPMSVKTPTMSDRGKFRAHHAKDNHDVPDLRFRCQSPCNVKSSHC